MKSWNTAVTRERHDASSSARTSTPSISIAPARGSYRRHRSLASVVLPAPFWPTMASDDPAGIDRSKWSRTSGTTRVSEAEIAEADLSRRRSRGLAIARRQGAGRPHRRLETQHRRDRRRGPVERPAEAAERDHRHPDGALDERDDLAEREPAVRGGARQRPEHHDVGDDDQHDAPQHRLLAQSCRGVLQIVETGAARNEAADGPVRQSEQAQFLARRCVHRQAVGVVGIALRGAHFLGVAVIPDPRLAQKPVRREPGCHQHDRRPPAYTRTARARRQIRQRFEPCRRR